MFITMHSKAYQNKESIVNRIFYFSFAILAVLFLKPYFTWNLPILKIWFVIFFIITLVYIFINNIYISRTQLVNLFWLWIMFFLYVINEPLINILTNGMILLFSLSILLILDNDKKLIVYDIFLNILCIIFVLGLIIHILLILGVDLPHHILNAPFVDKPIYRNYVFSVYAQYHGISEAVSLPFGGSVDRFCSIFNEPGVVGTVSSLILISRGYILKDKRNLILFLAGVFSLSFAFWIFCFGYFACKKKSLLLISATVMILIYFGLNENSALKKIIDNRIVDRLVIDKDTHKLAGNNRNNEIFDLIYADFLQNAPVSQKLTGLGVEKYTEEAVAVGAIASSYKSLIIIYGFLFSFVYFLYFIFQTIRYKNIDVFIFGVFFLVSHYQRPYTFSLDYWLIFFGGVAYILSDNKMSKRINIEERVENEKESIVCN
ncbi:hypothetical protein [Bacillus rhizoplanae]|uniref:hypothetical protein n=1 Tax=Bacillus rhizoplanae TaxID=2880966 RepID=UPI003D24AE48